MSNSKHKITRALIYLWVPVFAYLAGPVMASSHYDKQMETIKTNIAEKKRELQGGEERKAKAEDNYNESTKAGPTITTELTKRSKDLKYQALRMKAFKTWNAFVTMVGGGKSLIDKVNPGSALAGVANFLADRALEAGGNAPMKANMTKLKNVLVGTSPALEKLEKIMKSPRSYIFRRLQDEGQIPKNAYFRDYIAGKHDVMFIAAGNRYIRAAINEVIKETDNMLAEKPWEKIPEEYKKEYEKEGKQIEDLKAEITKLEDDYQRAKYSRDAQQRDATARARQKAADDKAAADKVAAAKVTPAQIPASKATPATKATPAQTPSAKAKAEAEAKIKAEEQKEFESKRQSEQKEKQRIEQISDRLDSPPVSEKKIIFTNPPGCPPAKVIVADQPDILPAATGLDYDEDRDSSKPKITIEEYSPDESSGADGRDGNVWTAEPDIPFADGDHIREPDIPTAKQSDEDQSTSLAIHLYTQPEKSVLQEGETVKILACIARVDAEALPLEFSWHGTDSSNGAIASVTADGPGMRTVSVIIKGKNGVSGRASLSLDVGEVTVVLTGYPRGPVTMGEDIPLRAQVQLDGKATKNNSYLYQWQPHPDPQFNFNPFDESRGKTTVRFAAPGTYKVWVDLYKKTTHSTIKLARSKQIKITVQGIDVTLSTDPVAPMVGQQVTVKATIPQNIDPKLIRFIWDSNGNFKNGAPAADGLSYSFIPVDTTPVTVLLKALAQEGELAELDNESVTIIAQTYQVSVSQPKRIGLPPRIWVPGKGSLEVPQAIAVFQNAEVHCTLSPKPDGRVRYNWKLNPDGCSVSTPYSSSTSLNAREKGIYQIFVTVTDKNGIELGQGKGSFSVTVSKRDMELARQKEADLKSAEKLLQDSRKLWDQGKLQQAISQLAKAKKLEDNNKKFTKALDVIKDLKDELDAKLMRVVGLIKQNKLDTADKVLSEAATINNKYSEYQQVLKQLAEAKEKAAKKKKLEDKSAALLRQAKEEWKNNDREQAINLAAKAGKVDPNNIEAGQLLRKWQLERTALEKKRRELINEGNDFEKKKKFAEAISKIQEAQSIRNDKKLSNQIEVLKEKRRQQKIREDKFRKLIKDAKNAAGNNDFTGGITLIEDALEIKPQQPEALELQKRWQKEMRKKEQEEKFNRLIKKGFTHEQNGELSEAVSIYQTALKIHKDEKITAHIRELEQRLLDRKAAQKLREDREKKFKQLISKGYQYEQQDQLGKAIDTYRKALKLHKDEKISAHIRELEEKLRQRQAKDEKRRPISVVPPWTGTYSFTIRDEDINLTMTIYLTQRVNRLKGNIHVRGQILGEAENSSGPIQGTSNGRSAQLQWTLDGETSSASGNLSADGNRISMSSEGESFTFQRR